MPSHMPSSFASAAAGQGSGRDVKSARGDGRGSGDWLRHNRPNGTAVLQLGGGRRSSNAPYTSTPQADSPSMVSNLETHILQGGHDQAGDSRFSKEQLLDIYKVHLGSEPPAKNVANLYVNGWDPEHSNGANGRGWGKSGDGRDNHGPHICWDGNGSVLPISLQEMSEAEKIAFAGDVNSPLKPPPQNPNKDPSAPGLGANGRKTSVSHVQGSAAFGVSSPASSRPSTRRQQTGDSTTGFGSPAGTARFSRDDQSPFVSRRTMDFKDGVDDRAEDSRAGPPTGGLMRSNTGGAALGNGPASPWSTTPHGAPMGNFGSFSLASQANPPTPSEKRPGFGRGESRLAHLMPKESSEDMHSRPSAERSWRSRPRTDTDPFGDEIPAGSAALGGGRDISPPPAPQQRAPGTDTPVRGATSEFGMSDMPGFRDSHHRGQNYQTPQGHHGEHDQLSPDTNPYRSPPEDRNDQDNESYDDEAIPHGRVQGLGGIPEHAPNPFGTLPRGFSSGAFDGSDRSQTSSVGASRGFSALGGLPSLSNLGGMGGWPTTGNHNIGTPDRENRPGYPSAFGNPLFGSGADLQSPGFGGLGGMFGPSSSGNLPASATIGRGSKLGSLFPAAMQAQMQGNEVESPIDAGEPRHGSAFGAIGRSTFPSRDTDSPMRAGKNPLEELFLQSESSRAHGPFSSAENAQGQTATISQNAQSGFQQSQASSDSATNQLPTAQNRQMVMPDRMRWVYLDPQGQMQGPWSGLEMHDWYKAQFFTPDLSVKKVEDTKFEPLGELIRRIGNSREPFLVPQIGIPHGPPSAQTGAAFTPAAAAAPGNATAQTGSVQPPFAGAFPSFGTTLTAEQQNNLERRKQEEQYLMARQREFLAQQQVNLKQLQMSAIPASLHHHSSAHSLQSQPSFGSIASPIGMPQQAPLSGVSNFFDGPSRQAPAQGGSSIPSDIFSQEDLSRLSLQDRQQLFSAASGQAPQEPLGSHAQQISSLFSQNVEAQREALRNEQLQQSDPQGFKARLREFEQLRAQHDLEEAAQPSANLTSDPIAPPLQSQQQQQERTESQPEDQREPGPQEPLSLTQQVQKAASAKQSPIPAPQVESPWAKVSTGLPMPFPAPQSTTPLPAPTAQRGRSNLPEALHAETRSRSETPDVATVTPSVAPWAKEPTEAPKGPSLKEIQEAEAKKAAKAEEIAAAARRAQHEQEMKFLTSQPAAQAPGLPTSSTWGRSASPAAQASAPSVWAAASAAKAPVSNNTAASKKTLADIQREEESRKQKLAAATAAAQPPQPASGGKRYADLASKPSIPGPVAGSPWATVGAGGKVRIPTGPAAVAPQAVRAPSSTTTPTPRVARPAPAVRSTPTPVQTGATAARDEFNKWAKGTLSKGLNSEINVDEFVTMILGFPSEAIADSVYAASQLMDGRRFAEEFIRRRKLADKGVVEPSSTGSGTSFSTAGDKSGWSEVAKKGPPKEESTAGFKVVPNKKKGRK